MSRHAVLDATPRTMSQSCMSLQRTPCQMITRIQYHRPSWTVERDGRIIETNQWDEKQHHKQQYKIIDEKVVPVDTVGNPQWQKTDRPGR